jgi:hypothetical protein
VGFTYQSVAPLIPINEERKLAKANQTSTETGEFYGKHAEENCWLEVSEGKNVSNPMGVKGGGKGVFAMVDIPAGTRICPYVGEVRSAPCSVEEGCNYDARVHAGFYICARSIEYDIGYFSQTDSTTWNGHKGVQVKRPCPPNFGRYVNSLTEEALSDGQVYNCSLENSDDGHDVIFITTLEFVRAGEELLMDYGTDFTVA